MKLQRLANFIGTTGLRSVLAKYLPVRGIVTLNYHRIGDGSRSNLDRGLWSASQDGFDQQIDYLKRNCDVITPADIDDACKDSRGLHVLVTFDDGYRDNYELAFPVLRRHNVSATFFIATGFIDNPRLAWWDEIAAIVRTSPCNELELQEWLPEPLPIVPGERQRTINTLLGTYKGLPVTQARELLSQLRETAAPEQGKPAGRNLWMTWDMIRDMAASGMTIGGHTVNHIVLSRTSKEKQWEEISGCAARIKQEIGTPMEYFAYPVGGRDSFNADTKECLRHAGTRYAFSHYGGIATQHKDPYDMPRMAMEPYVDHDWFRAMVEVPRVFCRADAPA